jgi:YVTN family beta-propeller protein
MKPIMWNPVLFILWLALLVCLPVSVSAAPFAYVPNCLDDTVSVIDTATNTVVDTVPVGRNPMAAAVHPDGSRVYVVESYLNHVSVISTATNTVVARVEVQEDPRGLAVHPDGSRVYVAGSWNSRLSILSTATNTVVGEVELVYMDGPWEVAFHPDGSRLYVSNHSTWNNTVSVVDTTTNTLITQVPTGVGGTGIAVHPDGTRVYIANSGSTNISVLGTATNTILDTVTLPTCSPQGVAVHPDGTRVYVACTGDYTLVVIDAATNTVVTSVPIVGFGVDPTSVAVHPDGTRVYVINKGADTVSVVDTGSNAVVDTIPVGDQPYSYGSFIRPPLLPATLLAPHDTGIEATPIYTWEAVTGATWYELWVADSTQYPKIDIWYTAAGVGCAGGGTCYVSPSVPLAQGPATWWIQWWGDWIGYGTWSNGMAFTVSGPSTMATLVSPSGTIATSNPTYTWNAVPGMTWYYLWVQDTTGAKVQVWMEASTAGCGSGTGTCSYTPSTAITPGPATWWIQVWSPAGYGPWSAGKAFTVGP